MKSKKKQANILDMLSKKKPTEEIRDGIKICPYLLNSNDITQETDYPVSVMAKVHFRDHSNIDEVLDRYLERENITNVNKEIYLATIIRHAISYRRIRRDYPFNMFKFESDYHESIGKFLLKYYEIKCVEDLKEANEFLIHNNLMHLQVSMHINNTFRDDEEEYIKQKREKIGYKNLKQYLCIGSDHALRQYYIKHDLSEKYHIDEISLEEMCQISTIERMTRRDMEQNGIPEHAFEECLNGVFQALKNDSSLAITLEGLYIYPQYLLIINNLTVEQERIVTENMKRFYAYTNAKDLLAIHKKNIPLPNQSDDPVANRKERRRLFYLKYIRQIDKKRFPFNNLLWIKKEDTDHQSNFNDALENVAGPSTSNVWKKKTVAEKNETIGTQNNNTAQVNLQKDKENAVVEHRLSRSPREYLKPQIFGSKYTEIILLLMNENEFVEELKKDITQNPLCAKMWDRNYKVILWNCIHINFEDRNEFFMDLLFKCSYETREQLSELLKKVDIDVNLMQGIGEPIATSTQTMDIPFDTVLSPITDNHQKRPFQSFNSEDIMDMVNKTPERSSPKKIKQEKICSQHSVNSSEVEIVPLNVTDVVSISDDESSIINNNRVIPENNGIDVYQQNLNVESQDNHDSNDINASLEAEYGLISYRNAVQNVTNRRRGRNRPSRIAYDSESTSSNNNGNSTNADFNIPQESNNFSIFFSTQLMFDYACHSTIQTLLTYAKVPKSTITSTYQNDYRPSFFLEVKRIMFIKNHKFEMLIDLPLFSLYDVHIRSSFVKEILNLNDQEWNILVSNLNSLESYEFVQKNYEHSRRKADDEFENVIKKHLDLYFSSLTNFKKFFYRLSEEQTNIECIKFNLNISSKNVTKSIKPSILQKMKLLKK